MQVETCTDMPSLRSTHTAPFKSGDDIIPGN